MHDPQWYNREWLRDFRKKRQLRIIDYLFEKEEAKKILDFLDETDFQTVDFSLSKRLENRLPKRLADAARMRIGYFFWTDCLGIKSFDEFLRKLEELSKGTPINCD